MFSFLTQFMYSWESLKSELWASSSVAAINCHSTNHLAWARSEHWNVFFQTLPMLTSRCGLARAGPKVTAVIDLFTGYSLLILWTEQRRRVKTWNSTSSSSKQPSDFVGYLLLGRRREGYYLLFNTVTVILLRWKHHVFAPRPMSHTLQVVSAPLLICMGICPLQKYCATLHAKLDIMLCKLCSIHHRFAAC